MNNFVPATLLADFYKLSHRVQYPSGTEYVFSTWTPRTSRIEGVNRVVAFGFQGFIKKYLINYFNQYFFNRPKQDVVDEYKRIVKYTLNVSDPETAHIEELHDLGYLPIKIKAVREGALVPIKVPMMTIENTLPQFFWITNFLETIMSSELWMASNNATIANEYKKIVNKYAELTGAEKAFTPFQCHDFSFRGMSSLESAQNSGAGHLLSFVGTDTIPAIIYHEQYYNANVENELVGCSVNATEHSVQCSYGKDGEFEAYRRLIEDVYPNGLVSIVSDTYDLWAVITDFLPRLKESIEKRNGKVILRPDSGNPILILTGDPDSDNEHAKKGVIQLLWEIFEGTTNSKGFKVLNEKIGTIYGDAISIPVAKEILQRLMDKGFASTNVVMGIGSFSYQYNNTRDTFGFALKSTHVVINGGEHNIFKDPITDTGKFKKSQKGRVVVIEDANQSEDIFYIDDLTIAQQEQYKDIDLLETVFEDGKLVRDQSLSEIRALLTHQMEVFNG